MKLMHESTVKNYDGLIDISVYVVNENKAKRYTYTLSSEFAAREFFSLYKRRKPGAALNFLKKNNINKPEKEVKQNE